MRRLIATHGVRDSYDYLWSFTLLGPDDSKDPTKPPYVVAVNLPEDFDQQYATGDTVRFDASLFEGIGAAFENGMTHYEPEDEASEYGEGTS